MAANRDSSGVANYRLWLYSEDGDGNRIAPKKSDVEYIPIRETMNAPNLTHGLEDRQEVSRAVDKLDDEERQVLKLQEEVTWTKKTRAVSPSLVDDLVRAGYWFIRTLKDGRAEVGCMFPVSLTYEQMGERLGLSATQVHRRVMTANRKLRGR